MGQQCSHTVQQVQQVIQHKMYESSVEQVKIEIDLMRNKNQQMIQKCITHISPDQKEQFFGYILNGKKQGYGQLKTSSEKRYYGYFKDNFPHIKGVLIFSNDHYYMGQFQNGKMHGKGKQISPFFTFEGSYSNDSRKYGKLLTQDFKYEGSFQSEGNLFGGYGQLSFKNGEKYLGNFVKGEFCGEGLYFDSQNRLIYEGTFKNNLYHGIGKYSWQDSSYYEGGYINGVKHGQGKYIKEAETLIHGIWQDGTLVSKFKDSFGKYSQSVKMNRSSHSTRIEQSY